MSQSRSVQLCQKPVVLSNYSKYLMCNSEPFNNLEESTTQSFTIVCIVESCETQQCALDLPSSCTRFFYPVTCDGEICISIGSLPCITGQTDLSLHNATLHKMLMR